MTCKIIAHRGANKKAPQNTLPAFERAALEGADGFETDVHLTADGRAVICHNYTIDATSDGRGAVADYTFDELRLFDFGFQFSEAFRGTPAPALEEFLEIAKNADLDVINIELKSPKNRNYAAVRKTLAAAHTFGVLDRVIVSSFDPRILREVKAEEPRCKTGFLYPCSDPKVSGIVPSALLCAKKIGADFIHPAYPFVNRALVLAAHRLGIGVNVWTVDNARTVAFLLACGVDGIITDCPLEARAWAEAAKKNRTPEPGLFAFSEKAPARI